MFVNKIQWILALGLLTVAAGWMIVPVAAQESAPEPVPTQTEVVEQPAQPATPASRLSEMDVAPFNVRLNRAGKLAIFGMIVVLVVLSLIASVTALVQGLDTRSQVRALAKSQAQARAQAQAAEAAGAAATPAAAPSAAQVAIDPETAAVITAAVTTLLKGRRFQIRGVSFSGFRSRAWGHMGRQSIHASHVLERKR